MTKSEYYEHKKKQAAAYKPVPANTYTINIPGMSDIFKLPVDALTNKQLKRERYQRFKTQKSPVPESLNWIPGIINQLDNAQDILYTAFFLAKPFLRRLPLRFIPYVGWGLLIMDIMNLGTKIFSMAMTPGLSKPCVRKTQKNYSKPKKFAADLFRDWIAPSGWRKWLGFALQAPQALETLTGYGLVLGSLMGAVSDFVWGIPRLLQGNKVVFRAPPPSDPAMKAVNYLTSDLFQHNMQDILTPEEHAMLILAHNAALTIIFDYGYVPNMERTAQLENIPVMTFEPWELSTLEILEEEGIDLREDIDAFTPIVKPTYDQIINEAIQTFPTWEKHARTFVNDSNYEFWSVIYQAWNECCYDPIEDITGIPKEHFLDDHYILKCCEELATFDFMPLIPPTDKQARQILDLALLKARAKGTPFPDLQDWKTSIETISGPTIPKAGAVPKNILWKV